LIAAAGLVLTLGSCQIASVPDLEDPTRPQEIVLSPGQYEVVSFTIDRENDQPFVLSFAESGAYAFRYVILKSEGGAPSFHTSFTQTSSVEPYEERDNRLGSATLNTYFQVTAAGEGIVSLRLYSAYHTKSVTLGALYERVGDILPARDYPKDRSMAPGERLSGRWGFEYDSYSRPNDYSDYVSVAATDLDEVYQCEVAFDHASSPLTDAERLTQCYVYDALWDSPLQEHGQGARILFQSAPGR
jgi:hypothetical protein